MLVLNDSNESMNWIVWFNFTSKNTSWRFWLFDSLFFNFWNKIVILFFFSTFFVLEKFYLLCSMFFAKFQYRVNLYSYVSQKNFVVMIICFRYVRNQKKNVVFFWFKKCVKCIRVDKKYEFAIFKVNFFDIDKTMTKFEKNKLKIKIVWKIANELTRSKQLKLKRFREQKRFLKKREQTMFDKSLNNVKQLKRFKKLKKIDEIE